MCICWIFHDEKWIFCLTEATRSFEISFNGVMCLYRLFISKIIGVYPYGISLIYKISTLISDRFFFCNFFFYNFLKFCIFYYFFCSPKYYHQNEVMRYMRLNLVCHMFLVGTSACWTGEVRIQVFRMPRLGLHIQAKVWAKDVSNLRWWKFCILWAWS